MENGWMNEYSYATYIDSGLACDDDHKAFTKEAAEYLKWDFDVLKGDMSLLQRMCDGVWDDSEFLVLEPGKTIAEDLTNPGIIKAE
jgi:hypothetical protein